MVKLQIINLSSKLVVTNPRQVLLVVGIYACSNFHCISL